MTKAPGIYQEVLPHANTLYTIAVPPGYADSDPAPLLLALHYGGPVSPYYGRGVLEGLVEPGLRELEAIIVAPDSLGDGWQGPRDEANVLALLDFVQAHFNIDAKRMLITGYSMGGMGTWYLAARHPDRFSVAVPIAGRPQADCLDFDWQAPLYAIHSRNDELIDVEPTETAVSQLQGRGANAQLVVVEGITHYETHQFVPHLRTAVPWIQEIWSGGVK